MKKLFLAGFLLLGTASLSLAQQIRVSNLTNHARTELIAIPYAKFNAHFKMDSLFTVKDASGQILPVQLEKLGQANPVNVLIQVAVPAKGQVALQVEKGRAAAIPSKTYARYVPERYDDFAWENDVVAFRMYGKALEGRPDDAQGIDVWAKRTDQLVINRWYKTDDYHKDHGEGLDYYSVGQTLGAGDMGYYFQDDLQFGKHYRRYQVLDNGPLRTTFRLDFDPETIAGHEVQLSKTISIDAGSHFNRIQLDLNNSKATTTPIAIGIVKRKEASPQLNLGKGNNSLAYWEPEINQSGHTAVAVLLPKHKVTYRNDKPEQALLISSVKNGKPFVYYNGAAWDRAGQVKDAATWNKLVEEEKENIHKPLKVVLK